MRKRGIRVSLIAACIMSMAMSFSSYAAYYRETYNCFRIEENYDWLGEHIENYLNDIDTDVYTLNVGWSITTNGRYVRYAVGWSRELVYDMNIWQRKCAPYASGEPIYISGIYYSDEDKSSYIEKMQEMINESNFNKAWLDKNMPTIVPEGTDVDDALRICYEWVQDNFTYGAREDLDGNDTYTWKAQTGLETGNACCVGYASQYRNMVNYLIFDSDNKVVYLEDKEIGPAYKKLNMYAVVGNGHAWNAVRSVHDGSWLYFDPTFDDRDDGEHHYKYYGLSAEQFYDGKEHMVSNGISEPKPWIRQKHISNMEYFNIETDNIELLK